jgi:hypothetical protein
MSYTIEVIKNTEIIRVTLKGIVTLDELINEIHELCVDYKTSTHFRLLVDTRLITQELTPSEQLLFATYITSREELNTAIIAVIVTSNQVMNEIIISKSAQLGHQIKVFTTEAQALDWLKR